MALQKFAAGQRVMISQTKGFAAPMGNYRVVRALPLESGPQQYQVKNENENFERIVIESRLEAVGFE